MTTGVHCLVWWSGVTARLRISRLAASSIISLYSHISFSDNLLVISTWILLLRQEVCASSFGYLSCLIYLFVASPGATPQSVPSYFSTSSGLDKQAETSVVRVSA